MTNTLTRPTATPTGGDTVITSPRSRTATPAAGEDGGANRRTQPAIMTPDKLLTTSMMPQESSTAGADDAPTYPMQLTTPPPHLRFAGGGVEAEPAKTPHMRTSRNREQPNETPVATETSSVATQTRAPRRPSGSDISLAASVTSAENGAPSYATTKARTVSSYIDAGIGATSSRTQRRTTAGASAPPMSSAPEDMQRNANSSAGEVDATQETSAVSMLGSSPKRPPSLAGLGLTGSSRQRERPLSSRKPQSRPGIIPNGGQSVRIPVSTTAPDITVGLTTAFSLQTSRPESDGSRGRVFRGSEADTQDAEGSREDETTCLVGNCPSSGFLGTAARPGTEAGASGTFPYDGQGDYMEESLGNNFTGGYDLNMGILQPDHFVVDSEETGKFINCAASVSNMLPSAFLLFSLKARCVIALLVCSYPRIHTRNPS